MTKIKTLIVDDHPLIAEAYLSALDNVTKLNGEVSFETIVAKSAQEALDSVSKLKGDALELIFLDIKIPGVKSKNIYSGEDLGIELKRTVPQAKIIVSTTYNDNFRINNILKSLDPDGFLVKGDITPEDLVKAIQAVLFDPPYYSKTVIKLLRKQITIDYFLDKIDRQLLHELSLGAKTSDLPELLNMSMGGVERRKRVLREIFNISQKNDKALVEAAKERGFI